MKPVRKRQQSDRWMDGYRYQICLKMDQGIHPMTLFTANSISVGKITSDII